MVKDTAAEYSDGLPTLSQSKASTWNTCRKKYHLKYVRKLRRRRVARPLTFGSAVHKVIEDRVMGVKESKLRASLDKWVEDELSRMNYFTAELELFHEAIEDAWVIMREYASFWPDNHLTFYEVGGKKAEIELHYPVPGEDFAINGKVDGYARSLNKLRWLVEHKTGAKMMAEDDRWKSTQAAVYDVVGEAMGYPTIDGIVWDMVRSKPPTKPQLLKAGTFSLKKLDSLPMMVYDTIKEAGHNPNNYPTLLASAEANRKTWFHRVFQPITRPIRDHLYGEFIETGRDILDNAHKTSRMTTGKHCGWCDFESICRAEMTNNDVEFVIEKEYTDAKATPKAEAKRKTRKRRKVNSLETPKPGGRRKLRRRQPG